MAKDFSYRGKSLEELKAMDIREFAKLVKSRNRRAILRQTNEISSFINKCDELKKKNKQIKTHSRNLVIVPAMIDQNILVHSGKIFTPVLIMPEMIGHRLGEFVITRQKVKHGSAGIGSTKSSMAKATKKT